MIRSVATAVGLMTLLFLQHPGPPDDEVARYPLACAHRGRLHADELENSVEVMQRTFRAGIKSVEFDLRESKDGVMFLCHDSSLDRTTNATGPVSSYTAAELSQVHLRDPSSKVTSEPLYRLEDLLDWAKKSGVQLLVDLKDTPPSHAAQAIRNRGMEQQAILLTFDEKTARAALEADPQIRVSMLVKTVPEVDAALAAAHGHPLALYVAQSADRAVYVYARQKAPFTLTDMLGRPEAEVGAQGVAALRTFLRAHPADLVVTNDAIGLQRASVHHEPGPKALTRAAY